MAGATPRPGGRRAAGDGASEKFSPNNKQRKKKKKNPEKGKHHKNVFYVQTNAVDRLRNDVLLADNGVHVRPIGIARLTKIAALETRDRERERERGGAHRIGVFY